MFGNREELLKQIRNNLVITIIASESNQNLMKSFLQEQTDQIYSNRLLINTISSHEELKLDKGVKIGPKSLGLINTHWITKTTTLKPSVTLVIKQMPPEHPFREIEKQWIKEIKTIRSYLPETLIFLYILTGTLPNIDESTDRSDSIFKLSEIHSVQNYISLEVIKKSTEVRKIQMTVINAAKDYYHTLKKKYKQKAYDQMTRIEHKTKALVKLGVLSVIKNKKLKVKYFEEAYKLLLNYNDMTKYYFGDNKHVNFCEIRGAADWLFFQLYKINRIRKDSSREAFYLKANAHISKFSHNLFIEKPEDAVFHFFDQYWCYTFNEFIGNDNTIDLRELKSINSSQNFPGFYTMKSMFNLTRMLKQLTEYDSISLNTVVIDTKKYNIDQLKKLQSKYYEKPILYYDNKDVLNPIYFPFNAELYLRYFILENNINYTHLNGIIRQNLHPKLLKAFDLDNRFIDVNFYLNVLNMHNELPENQQGGIEQLYSSMIKSKNLWKYPKVYYHFLNKANDVLMEMTEMSLLDKERLFKNLLLVANNRDLLSKEEEAFFRLLDDKDLRDSPMSKTPIKIKANDDDDSLNRIFNIEHSIVGGNITRNILELVEFEFNISTSIKMKSMKMNTITCYFGYDKRNKKFTSFDNELSSDTPIKLNHRILLKNNEKALMLKSVVFELEGYPYLFEYKVYAKKEKVVLVKPKQKSLLEFKVPKVVKMGVNESYAIHCDIIKDNSVDVEIGSMTIDFELSHTISDFMTKTTSGQSQQSQVSASTIATPNATRTTSSSMRNTFDQIVNKDNQSTKSNRPPSQSVQLPTPTPTPTLAPAPSSSKHSDTKVIDIGPYFYIKDKDNTITQKADKYSYRTENFETSSKSLSFVIKFKEVGKYTLGFVAKYRIIKQEFTEDQVEAREYGKISFEVINPFDIKYEMDSNIYMTYKTIKTFNIDSKVKVNLIITNNLESNCSIQSIQLTPKEESIHIDTPLNQILTLPCNISESILTIMKNSSYIIPFEVNFKSEFNGFFGNVSINWTTAPLKDFSPDLVNSNEFEFPEISTMNFNVDFEYEFPKEVSMGNEFDLVIKCHNRENVFKRIIFLIHNSDNFALCGPLKKKLVLYPNETREMMVKLIPLTQGKIKLPPCKIMDYAIQKFDNKIHSIYFLPEYVIVKG